MNNEIIVNDKEGFDWNSLYANNNFALNLRN